MLKNLKIYIFIDQIWIYMQLDTNNNIMLHNSSGQFIDFDVATNCTFSLTKIKYI